MEWLDTLLKSSGFALAIIVIFVGFVIFAFVKGWVIPASQMRNLLDVLTGRVTDANKRGDDWYAAYLIEREKNEVLVEVVGKLTIVGETTDKILKSLPPHGEEDSR